MQASQSMYNLSSVSSPQYVPSHLRQSHRAPQTPRSSPPRIRRSSTTGRFGGPSFGTPKPTRTSKAYEASMADAPPTESIYDFQGGSSFTIAQPSQQQTAIGTSTLSKTSNTTTTLASLPRAVVIFGFPAQMKSTVLSHFSRFGAIEDQSTSDTQVENNFMKITYKESTAAQSAVAANGTFVNGQFMVGCVFAQEEPLANVDTNQDDAMDIDPQTPPRPKAVTQNRINPYSTPQRAGGQSSHVPASTPGGRRIEVLSSDAIYKSTSPLSERAAAWLPSWTTTTTTAGGGGGDQQSSQAAGPGAGAQSTHQPGWTTKIIRGLVDTIFGF